MFVTRLVGPEGADDICNPTWSEIEMAIRSLDGVTKTLVTLSPGDIDAHMGIGGGGTLLVCYATSDNCSFHTLVNPLGRTDTMLRLAAGGQPGDYSERHCVSMATVLKAAKSYCDGGRVDDSLTWDIR